jgi:hypothetical protein
VKWDWKRGWRCSQRSMVGGFMVEALSRMTWMSRTRKSASGLRNVGLVALGENIRAHIDNYYTIKLQ